MQKNLRFLKAKAPSHFYLAQEPSTDAWIVSTCSGDKSSSLFAICCVEACYSSHGGTARSEFKVLIQKGYVSVYLVRTQVWVLVYHMVT